MDQLFGLQHRRTDPLNPEDDMDDNGMSRYMENDDEEGWD